MALYDMNKQIQFRRQDCLSALTEESEDLDYILGSRTDVLCDLGQVTSHLTLFSVFPVYIIKSLKQNCLLLCMYSVPHTAQPSSHLGL